MREPAMVRKSIYRAFDQTDDIEVGSLSSERHGCRSQCRLAVESGAGEDCAGEEVGDGFQRKVLTDQYHEGHEGTRRKAQETT